MIKPLTQVEREQIYAVAPWLDEYIPANTQPPIGGWRPFKKARNFMRSRGLKGQRDWHEFSASDRRPTDIPSNPEQHYVKDGWMGWPDFLGYEGYLVRGSCRSFTAARRFVRRLKLANQKAWDSYCKSGKKPKDIPAAPQGVYEKKEWKGWPDWLGYDSYFQTPRSFNQARSFVRKQGFKKWNDFRAWENRPNDIPTAPHRVYKDKGWISFGDFLGTGTVSVLKRNFLPFKEARAVVRKQGFKREKELRAWKRPNNIPSSPQRHYKGKGWVSLPDWMGYKTFRRAKIPVRKRDFKGQKEFLAWKNSKDAPSIQDDRAIAAKRGWLKRRRLFRTKFKKVVDNTMPRTAMPSGD